MKRFLAAVVIVLVFCSVASAHWPYVVSRPVVVPAPVVAPPPVVHHFHPVGPVYAYPPPVVAYRPPVVAYRPPVVAYRPPVVAYRPPVVVYRPTVVAAPVYYPAPVGVRPKVYVVGQPVRNVLRAVTP
jgi:hypothetical protein